MKKEFEEKKCNKLKDEIEKLDKSCSKKCDKKTKKKLNKNKKEYKKLCTDKLEENKKSK